MNNSLKKIEEEFSKIIICVNTKKFRDEFILEKIKNGKGNILFICKEGIEKTELKRKVLKENHKLIGASVKNEIFEMENKIIHFTTYEWCEKYLESKHNNFNTVFIINPQKVENEFVRCAKRIKSNKKYMVGMPREKNESVYFGIITPDEFARTWWYADYEEWGKFKE